MDAPTFHAGERALQARAGSRERLAEVGARVIRPAMPEQHRAFFEGLPFVLLGGRDDGGQPWATALCGPTGFVTAPTEHHLRLHAMPDAGDPLGCLSAGARFGLLGIEPHTRRRNRANGRVEKVDGEGLTLRVEQSFGNCPKYIQPRQAEFAPDVGPAGPVIRRHGLGDEARRLVEQADTFFIASAYPAAADDPDPAHGVDVSHRGGPAGFVKVEDGVLWVPDFTGNNYFNTLGNLLLDARAGLLFMDFARGDLAWIAAEARIVENGPGLPALPGALRLIRLRVTESRFRPGALPLRWTPLRDG